jgi:choline-sulfatase
MTDQQRPDSLGCYGSEIALTPNLDALAEQGIAFDNCYVQNPLCCPSRYSILTGRYPHSHRVRANWYQVRDGETSFAHQLNRRGYNTAAIGKMHFTPWYDNFGFDGRIIAESKFHTKCPDDYERFLNAHGTSRTELYDLDSERYRRNCSAVKSRVPQEQHIDSFVGMSVCEYLRRSSEPFCVFASFLSPHNPYDPPEPYDELFENVEFPPRNMGEGEVHRKPSDAYDYINKRLNGEKANEAWDSTTDQLTDEQVRKMKAHYYATNTLVDDWVGRIIEVLQSEGIYEDTIIIYSSDHGDLLGDHGLVFKQCFYEQSVRVPLIIHAPHMFDPRRVDNLVESIDLFDTICDLGGARRGEGSQGKSLLPLLKGAENYAHREAAFSENYFGRMVRYRDYKMVYYPGKPYGEIYNLAEDPQEQDNLWDALEGSAIKRELKDLLLEWAFASEDDLPLPTRPGHQDGRPRQYRLEGGDTVECEKQPWYIPGMDDVYASWDFSEKCRMR